MFISASTTETQGLTTIEAMAAGCVPVCINDESFINVVKNDVNGNIFKNRKECSKQVLDIIDNPDKLKRLSNHARIDSERYSSKYYAESVLDVYKIAMQNKKGRFGWFSDIYKKVTSKK